jgi:hypothetical protein
MLKNVKIYGILRIIFWMKEEKEIMHKRHSIRFIGSNLPYSQNPVRLRKKAVQGK